jgi:hypothetical protein
MDIKRVAFETRPVASKRPAVAAQQVSAMPAPAPSRPAPALAPSTAQSASAPKVSREEIAAIVDRFLANREPEVSPLPSPPTVQAPPAAPRPIQASPPPSSSSNGRKAADFVSEDDVKRALQKGEKIYVGPKTIITPSARDIGEPAEVFAKA